MTIALDYDGTYTRAPVVWDGFIALAEVEGGYFLFRNTPRATLHP